MADFHPAISAFRGLTAPVAVLVAVVVAAAWIVTWAASDLMNAGMGMSMSPLGPVDLAVFFAVLVVMMVAMMLPAAVPMIVAFRGLTKLEAGRPVRPADDLASSLFVIPYFLVWGGFALVAVLSLVYVGFVGSMAGDMSAPITFVPAIVLFAAGAWQVTRTKEVCLSHCQSPMTFVMRHWRSGRIGAFRMGLRHSMFCIGCCWLFMIVLFVTGAMSLLWMAGLSVAIFAEKVSPPNRPAAARAIGVVLIALGLIVAIRPFVGR